MVTKYLFTEQYCFIIICQMMIIKFEDYQNYLYLLFPHRLVNDQSYMQIDSKVNWMFLKCQPKQFKPNLHFNVKIAKKLKSYLLKCFISLDIHFEQVLDYYLKVDCQYFDCGLSGFMSFPQKAKIIIIVVAKFTFAFAKEFATFAIIVIYSLCLKWRPVFILDLLSYSVTTYEVHCFAKWQLQHLL